MSLVTLMTFLTVTTTIVLNWSAPTTEASPTSSLQSDLKDLVNKRKSLNLLRFIIDDLDSNLLALNKHGCDLNLAGYDCDNLYVSDYPVTGSGHHWPTPDEPTMGQKRAPCLNFDGTACVTVHTAEEMKNRKGWKVGPGRRKRYANWERK